MFKACVSESHWERTLLKEKFENCILSPAVLEIGENATDEAMAPPRIPVFATNCVYERLISLEESAYKAPPARVEESVVTC